MIPAPKYYALFEDATTGKTPKYRITQSAGYYHEMETLVCNGAITMQYVPAVNASNADTPPMRLQARKSYNFTGFYHLQSKVTAKGNTVYFAYGTPNNNKTYRYKGADVPNEFYNSRNDAYLFVIYPQPAGQALKPLKMEMLVFADCKYIAPEMLRMLINGELNTELLSMRQQARKEAV